MSIEYEYEEISNADFDFASFNYSIHGPGIKDKIEIHVALGIEMELGGSSGCDCPPSMYDPGCDCDNFEHTVNILTDNPDFYLFVNDKYVEDSENDFEGYLSKLLNMSKDEIEELLTNLVKDATERGDDVAESDALSDEWEEMESNWCDSDCDQGDCD